MNNDEKLLEALRDVVREEEREHAPRSAWEALALGKLPPESRSELEQQAASDAEARELLELYRPLVDETYAKFEQAVHREFEADGGRNSALQSTAKVIPFRRIARALGTVAPLAAVAALALWLRSPSSPPIGDYDLVLTSADVKSRAATAPEAANAGVQTGRDFEMVLHPKEAIEGEIAVRTFLVRDGRARPWNAPIEISPKRTVRIAGDVEALFGDRRGDVEILVAIGRPDALPETPEAALRAKADHNARWRLLRARVTLGTR